MMLTIWLVWIIMFLVVEGLALYRRRSQDTFSWQVWTIERRVPWLKWVVAIFLLWLILHFYTGA